MLLRTLFLLLAAVGCYAVETPVLGSGDPPASGSIFPGGVVPSNTQVVYSNGTTLAGDDGLKYTAASDLLVVNHNAAAAPAAPTGTQLQVLGIDATSGVITIDAGAAQASFLGRRANTSIGNPAALVNNDTIVQLAAQGYGATAYTTSARGIVRVVATETWTDAAMGTRLEFLTTANTTLTTATRLTITGASATFATGVPVTISDTTASSTTAGALLIGTGTAATSVTFGNGSGNVGANLTVGGLLTVTGSSGRLRMQGPVTTADVTGECAIWRSGGTIGSSGDMVLQSDLAADANFVFRNGITTPQTILTIGSAVAAGTTPALATSGTSTIGAGVTDGYVAGERQSPIYNGAFTVTRHNYFNLNNTSGTSTITDACIFRFDAAAGTHKAVDAGTTKTTPGTVTCWLKVNVNGTLVYIPCYSSKTSMASPIERAVRATISLPTEPCERVSYERATEAA